MIANQGVNILAICMDSEPAKVLVEGPDGRQQVCDVTGWFVNGDPPRKTSSPLLADTFSFDVFGFDERGNECTSRYDGRLQGIGQPIPRQADGTFGTRAGRSMVSAFNDNAARLPN